MRHPADGDLVRRMLAGRRDAFDEFGERYHRALYRFALPRLDGDRELTRDTVQTTVTKALAKLDTYRGDAALLTWLCAICRNEVLMHRRRRGAAPEEVALADDVEPSAAAPVAAAPEDPERRLLDREERGLVHAVLAALPERYARALAWKYLERLPVDAVANRLGVGPKAAESLLTRARRAFLGSWEELAAGRPTASPPPTARLLRWPRNS